eukprot:TRINITY_DN1593_c0_g1_i1.p1 TRINITY_DN1593_c0_g1~~TRINITY_DN1593_c0_g1_i1.p1  ORF type:complete len:360 (+),score=91.62 TRINITY_DN1593_c0_g1_i1:120-1199(+)
MWDGADYTLSVSTTDDFITKNVATSLAFKEEDLKALVDLTQNNIQEEKHWLSMFFVYLGSWLKVEEEVQLEDPDLILDQEPITPEQDGTDIWLQWEWILGRAEEALMKKEEENSEALKNELKELRKRANRLKTKPRFFDEAKNVFDTSLTLEDAITLQVNVLDSSKRSKIISDIISNNSNHWISFIRLAFFIDADDDFFIYKEVWEEGAYRKGVVGGLKEVAWKASHGNGKEGLTTNVLCDILWSLWNSLCFSISSVLDRPLTYDEQEGVASKICECKEELVKMWVSTIKNSLLGTSLAGQVVEKWREADRQRKAKLEVIKKQGSDAKYEYKKTVITAAERKPIGELRKMLESQLVFRS